ncbi:vitelline membrane outer layer protein 1 homolog [Rhineura floridana]|uniref:vitelline membrane outer layer protein 1 homolog n=1 Tax=Rhineura floridana TaxID=261503 RepID=UPI002AC82EB3|nr:vitelline membrane outer layer protein 1 homolog [Rhineura floridana]
MLNVSNGGAEGVWGQPEFCKSGYADGFAVKVSGHQSNLFCPTGARCGLALLGWHIHPLLSWAVQWPTAGEGDPTRARAECGAAGVTPGLPPRARQHSAEQDPSALCPGGNITSSVGKYLSSVFSSPGQTCPVLSVSPHRALFPVPSSSSLPSSEPHPLFASPNPSWGKWTTSQWCSKGPLVSFQLQVEFRRRGLDATAANGLRMRCRDKEDLQVHQDGWGEWGLWSAPCPRGYICGLQTRVQPPVGIKDDTALNDARFFCCC